MDNFYYYGVVCNLLDNNFLDIFEVSLKLE